MLKQGQAIALCASRTTSGFAAQVRQETQRAQHCQRGFYANRRGIEQLAATMAL